MAIDELVGRGHAAPALIVLYTFHASCPSTTNVKNIQTAEVSPEKCVILSYVTTPPERLRFVLYIVYAERVVCCIVLL